jgi:hypothetical protein
MLGAGLQLEYGARAEATAVTVKRRPNSAGPRAFRGAFSRELTLEQWKQIAEKKRQELAAANAAQHKDDVSAKEN